MCGYVYGCICVYVCVCVAPPGLRQCLHHHHCHPPTRGNAWQGGGLTCHHAARGGAGLDFVLGGFDLCRSGAMSVSAGRGRSGASGAGRGGRGTRGVGTAEVGRVKLQSHPTPMWPSRGPEGILLGLPRPGP